MVQPIPNSWKEIWNKWNVRGVILFSLCLQIFLILSASSRKRTRSCVLWFVWLAYLLADWAASFCVGLISNEQDSKSTFTKKDFLTAFWAPFLLLHLGGPDTITAFALEDNELWLRHLLSLIFQAVATAYVFLLTVPQNTLWLPTVMVFLAGLIKYAERTRSLYVASIKNFRQHLIPEPDAGPNYAKLMEEHSARNQAGLPAKIIRMPEFQGQEKINEATTDPPLQEKKRDEISDQEKNKKAAIGPAHPGKKNNEISDLEAAQKAHYFFQKFKGLIVDMIYSFSDRNESLQYFKGKAPEEVLRVIEIELNFMYEAFYTKAFVIRHWLGYLCKFVSFSSIVAAFGLFISADKKGFNMFDVRVTYALLCGALALDTMAFFMLIFTDYTATLSDGSQTESYGASRFQKLRRSFFNCFNKKILKHFLRLRRPRWEPIKLGPHQCSQKLCTPLLFRRWSRSISGHNFLDYCLQKSVPGFVPNLDQRLPFHKVIFKVEPYVRAAFGEVVNDLLDQWIFEAKNPLLKELWEHIFHKLEQKSAEFDDVEAIQSACSARGEGVLDKMKDLPTRDKLKPFVDPNEVAFDQSLLLWHIATTLLYFIDVGDHDGKKRKIISKILSDYMLYLLVMQPTMMSAVSGIGQIRFQDTLAEAEKFFSRRSVGKSEIEKMKKKACELLTGVPTELKPVDVKGDRSKSLLFDACMLAKVLNKLENDEKWEMIASVWVELLSFAASHCRPTGHVQLLSKGGELISFVWLLMLHLGLATQFQIKEGHARAKLLVGK